jgi:hypothetical protein
MAPDTHPTAKSDQKPQKNNKNIKQSPKQSTESIPIASVLLTHPVPQTQPSLLPVKETDSPQPGAGLSYRATTNARGVLFSPTNQPIPFYPDTGTSISLIARKTLQEAFPDVPI